MIQRKTMRRGPSSTASVELESHLQNWLVDLVKKNSLAGIIAGSDAIHAIVSAAADESSSPVFSIDRLPRQRYAESARTALNCLSTLDLVSADRNVSRTVGESLRPDIVAYNPQDGVFVVFELKKSSQTGRQALTELFAYEHELQNYLPLLGGAEVIYVLISSEWSTLMDHAISGAVTWAGKTCLCLEVTGKPRDWGLRVRIPDAWDPLLSNDLPPGALSTATLHLYKRGDKAPKDDAKNPEESALSSPRRSSDDAQLRELLTACELVVREGERINSHGFVVLCENRESPDCPWIIVIGVLNPFAFHREWVSTTQGVESKISDYLSKLDDEIPPDSGIIRASGRAIKYLSESYSAKWESFDEWLPIRTRLRAIAMPLRLDFWGVLGEFAREFVLHPALRANQLSILNITKHDWHEPLIGVPILDELTRNRPFMEGLARCSDCFRFGTLLGTASIAYGNAPPRGPDATPWSTLASWVEASIAGSSWEAGMLWRASTDIAEPPPTLLLGNGASVEDKEASLVKYCEWVVEHLIGATNPFHQQLFAVGIHTASFFDLTVRDCISSNQAAQNRNVACELIRRAVRLSVERYRDLDSEELASPTVRMLVGEICRRLGFGRRKVTRISRKRLDEALDALNPDDFFEDLEALLLPVLDEMIDPVFHPLADPTYIAADWEYLKSAVRRARAEAGPQQQPAVILAPDGRLSAGLVLAPAIANVEDEETQVYYLNRGAGLAVLRPTTWEALAKGDFGMTPSKAVES